MVCMNALSAETVGSFMPRTSGVRFGRKDSQEFPATAIARKRVRSTRRRASDRLKDKRHHLAIISLNQLRGNDIALSFVCCERRQAGAGDGAGGRSRRSCASGG
eukprot:2668290-Pleurochrysis_carterae.AAC.1